MDDDFNKALEENKGLIISITKNYYDNGLSKFELESHGDFGFWQAWENFDETLGYKLSTFATRYIKTAIEEAIDKEKGVSTYKIKQLNRIKKIEGQLTNELNRKPTDEELADKSEVPIDKIRKLKIESQGVISLDDSLNSDSDSNITIEDLITYDSTSIEDKMIQAEEEVYNARRDGFFSNTLLPHERAIFKLCIKQKNSHDDVGKILGVNRERIRTKRHEIEKRYKSFLQSKEYEKYLIKKETSMLKEIVEKHRKQLGASAKDEKIMMYENYEGLSEIDFDKIRERQRENDTIITSNKTRFARYFKYLCCKYGVTKTNFTRATGRTDRTFERYKAGTYDPSFRAIVAFGIYFKIDSGVIEDLLRRGGYVLSDTNKGMNPRALQYIMGHKNILTTLNYYTHVTFNSAKIEMERVLKQNFYYPFTTFKDENIRNYKSICEHLPNNKNVVNA